jgi:hypothetical protein
MAADPIMAAQDALRNAVDQVQRTRVYYDYLNDDRSKALREIHETLIAQHLRINAIINE